MTMPNDREHAVCGEVETMCARLIECGPANFHNGTGWVGKPYNRDGVEAAAMLTALTAEVERLRGAMDMAMRHDAACIERVKANTIEACIAELLAYPHLHGADAARAIRALAGEGV